MTSYIKFTALSGSAHGEGPLCYLLEVDEARILLDCGWSDRFDVEDLVHLKKVTHSIDAVLLSHADLPHLGGLPYAYAKLGLTCPVYATTPVQNLGHMCMIDALKSRTDYEEFTLFNQKDVDSAFSRITGLRFIQPLPLSGKCQGIVITAYSAGHTLGGTVWKIKKDTDEIVYAVDFNHRKERHLDGTDLLSSEALNRPSVLITDTRNYLVPSSAPRKQRETLFIDTIINTLRTDGNVLIPVDSSTRVLEICQILEQHWSQHRLPYPLAMLTHKSFKTIQFAKSLLEYMGEGITKSFSQQRENPFELRHIKLLHSLDELERISSKSSPKVILCSLPSLDAGFSQQLFAEWAGNPRNTVLLIDRGPLNSLSRELYSEWEGSQSNTNNGIFEMDRELLLTLHKKIALEGDELMTYLAWAQKKKESEAAEVALLKTNVSGKVLENDDDEVDIDELGNLDATRLDANMVQQAATSGQGQFDIFVKGEEKMVGFFKGAQSYRMFPVHESRKRYDDYGEIIQPEVYARGEFQFAKKQNMLQENDRSVMNRSDDSMQLDNEIKKEDSGTGMDNDEEIPSKYVVESFKCSSQCKLAFVDFEGLVDGKSIKNILSQVAPRKLILVDGNADSTEALQKFCMETDNITNELFAPNIGETVNVSSATNIFQLKLTDALFSSLDMQKVGDYDVAYISGQIHLPEGPDAAAESVPSLDILPSDREMFHRPIVLGDVRLTDLKKMLAQEGLVTEFVGGVLKCFFPGNSSNKFVAVQKNSSGEWSVEGSVGKEYFVVRKILYKLHCVL